MGPCAEKMVLERMEDIQYTVVIRCVYFTEKENDRLRCHVDRCRLRWSWSGNEGRDSHSGQDILVQ